MIHCIIKGCEESASETFTSAEDLKRWVIFRACRCGAYSLTEPKSCVCQSEGPVPISYWPNLDWWAFGGVEEIIICPDHKLEIFNEIIKQREADPTMNQTQQNRGNLH
jgi:hypothetical protein